MTRFFELSGWIGWGRSALVGSTVLLGSTVSIGCNAFDDPAPETRTVRIIPTDDRAPVSSERPLLPVSGGTLLSLRLNLGSTEGLVASDPSSDTVSVSFETNSVRVVELPQGSEPGRLAHLGGTQVAVVLRGTHRVSAFDLGLAEPTALWSTRVCTAPRGVAFEPHTQQVHVACTDGHLVSLDARTGQRVADVVLDSDLRDVVAADGRLYVSRFRAAEVLWVEGGVLTRRVTLPEVYVRDSFGRNVRPMRPTVAWRMQSHPNGGVLVVHQRAATDEVGIDPTSSEDSGIEASPYGGGNGPACSSIVQTAVTQVNAAGAVFTSSSLAGVILPVDLAVSPNGQQFAIADAGTRDPMSPSSSVRVLHRDDSFGDSDVGGVGSAFFFGGGGLAVFSLYDLHAARESERLVVDCAFGDSDFVSHSTVPTTAVTFQGEDLVGQQAASGWLLRVRRQSTPEQIPIGSGGVAVDTGHELFHRDSGSGIACASCHPEGTTDGHVWKFQGLGQRRTQNLAVPLEETAPFHWEGELPSLGALMDEVFVERMGGVFQSEQRLASLEQWLFTAPRPVQLREIDDAAERGRSLFESSEVGCATCHRGKALTDNLSHLVGTTKKGVRLQTPSLVGIAAHPPYLHDGCAKTLRERFDPDCGGGDEHGRTSHLSDAQLDDLVAYLETL